MENAKKFFEEIIRTDEAKKLFGSMESPKSESEALNGYVTVAAQLGCELTVEDIRAYLAQKIENGKLDDKELEQVAGGAGCGDCRYSFIDRENCWMDDGCDNLICEYIHYNCSWFRGGLFSD